MSVVVSFALPDDEHVGRVASLLSEAGVVTLSCSPISSQEIGGPKMGWGADVSTWSLPRLDGGGHETFDPRAAVFWFRNKHTVDAINTAQEQREFFEFHTRQHFLVGFVHSEQARAVNARLQINRAAFKLHQLRVAPGYGLRVPRTLISSDKNDILAFTREYPSIVKPLHIGNVAAPALEEGPPIVMMTSRLGHEDVEQADPSEFTSAPMIIQEEIEKDHELRVVVFGDDVLAYRIRSQDHEISKIDWRWGESLGISQPCSVPEQLANQLKSFLAGEGLDTGVFDLVVTPDGEIYFLECNPSGQWAMLEDPQHQEIAVMFAKNLKGLSTASALRNAA